MSHLVTVVRVSVKALLVSMLVLVPAAAAKGPKPAFADPTTQETFLELKNNANGDWDRWRQEANSDLSDEEQQLGLCLEHLKAAQEPPSAELARRVETMRAVVQDAQEMAEQAYGPIIQELRAMYRSAQQSDQAGYDMHGARADALIKDALAAATARTARLSALEPGYKELVASVPETWEDVGVLRTLLSTTVTPTGVKQTLSGAGPGMLRIDYESLNVLAPYLAQADPGQPR